MRSISRAWADQGRCNGLTTLHDRHGGLRGRADAGRRGPPRPGRARIRAVPLRRRRWRLMRPGAGCGLVGGDDPIGVHVPVNRLAEQHRHHGFGFTDYLLVLSDRTGEQAEPPPAAAWLSAAFSRCRCRRRRGCGRVSLEGAGTPRQGLGRHEDGPVAAARPRQRLRRPGARRAHRPGVRRVDALRDADHRPGRLRSGRGACQGVGRRHLCATPRSFSPPPPRSGTRRTGSRRADPPGAMPMRTTAIRRRWSGGSRPSWDAKGPGGPSPSH